MRTIPPSGHTLRKVPRNWYRSSNEEYCSCTAVPTLIWSGLAFYGLLEVSLLHAAGRDEMPPCRAYRVGHLDSPDWEGPLTNKRLLHIVHTNLAWLPGYSTCTHAVMHAASTPQHWRDSWHRHDKIQFHLLGKSKGLGGTLHVDREAEAICDNSMRVLQQSHETLHQVASGRLPRLSLEARIVTTTMRGN